MCKGYAWLSGNAYQNLPTSKADYLNRFQKSGDKFAYNKAPLVGSIPQNPALGWTEWRDNIFKAKTGCNPTNGGVFQSNSAYFNILGQQVTEQYANPGDCEKLTGYSTKYIDGIYYSEEDQPLTLKQLYSYSNPYVGGVNRFAAAQKFCDNLLYANGDTVPPSERPFCCGGNGPDISNYNPAVTALNEILPEINGMQADFEKSFVETGKKIRGFWGIAFLFVLMLVIFRFF